MVILFLVICFSVCSTANGAACKSGDHVGEGDPKSKNKNIDSTNGLSLFFDRNDDKMKFDCCGVVTQWEFYAKSNTGTVHFQVWRSTGSTWELAGENQYTVTSTDDEIQYSVPAGQQINVLNGDIIGIYQPGSPIVSHKSEGKGNSQYRETTSISGLAVGGTFNWNGVTQNSGRKYGIRADLSPGNSPSLTNLDNSVSFTDDTVTGSLLYTVAASDLDATDTLTVSMTTVTSSYSFDTNTLQVRNIGTMTVGSSSLNFQVSDLCGNTDTGTLTVVVTNIPPVINNLPSSAEVSEDQTTELELYVINATDASAGDTVTCSVQSSNPASSIFSTKISSGTQYGIYIQANPSLSYDTVNAYDLTISCTDTKDPVTSTFNIYITRNSAPVITNLQTTVNVSAKTTTSGLTVYTVTSTDAENDQLFYNMTCLPVSCPFTIFNSGEVQSSTNLQGTSVSGYDLFVYVYDGRTLVGPKTLTLTVKDINDMPVITNLPSTTLSVPENSALGHSIYRVMYTDVNDGDVHTLTASVNPVSGGNIFSVDSTTGVISTSSTTNIDFETLSTYLYNITIDLSDGLALTSSSLNIEVVDVNEAPVFGNSMYYLSGNEGNAGISFGTPSFVVTDPDAGATKSYSMDCNEFNMDVSNAEVTLALNYDLDVAGTNANVICNVTVSDGSLTDSTMLTITINDANDNTPTFALSAYTFYAQSYAAIGTTLGSIAATDGDLGTYGSISYSLNQAGLGTDYFGVQSSGDIYVRSSLSSFYSGTTLSLTATVTDSGGLTDTASITVVIPKFITTTPAPVTERYITFAEDPINIAWITVSSVILVGLAALIVYIFYYLGDCQRLTNLCQDRSSSKFSYEHHHLKPRQYRTYYPEVHEHKRSSQKVTNPSNTTRESDWKPWRTGTEDL